MWKEVLGTHYTTWLQLWSSNERGHYTLTYKLVRVCDCIGHKNFKRKKKGHIVCYNSRKQKAKKPQAKITPHWLLGVQGSQPREGGQILTNKAQTTIAVEKKGQPIAEGYTCTLVYRERYKWGNHCELQGNAMVIHVHVHATLSTDWVHLSCRRVSSTSTVMPASKEGLGS